MINKKSPHEDAFYAKNMEVLMKELQGLPDDLIKAERFWLYCTSCFSTMLEAEDYYREYIGWASLILNRKSKESKT